MRKSENTFLASSLNLYFGILGSSLSKAIVTAQLLLFINLPAANANSEISKCKDTQGLKVVTDYTPEGKPFIKKILSPLYTAQSDESYITHIVVNDSKFKKENVEVLIDLLNSDKKSIKKFILKSWMTDKDLPNLKITKINFSKFLKSKLADPYDKYANLDQTLKSNQKKSEIPSDAKISIRNKNQKPFCVFEYKYGSVSEY